jgi:CHRD domain-containing protein
MKTAARLLALCLIVGPASAAQASDDKVVTRLSGYNEVHFIADPPALRGAVSSPARGTFEARINDREDVIEYELTYEGLTTDVTQAHIHFGQRHTVGNIVVWLCQTAAVPAPPAVAALTPTCPGPTQGKVTGTITPAQVLAATGQGIAAGEFDEVVAAIRAGRAYANVHSTTFPPGEIRGQINHDRGHRH